MNLFLLLFTLLQGILPHTGVSVDKLNSTNSALVQNSINCIFQDSDERIWIGNYGGLNYFDGSDIKVYKNEANQSTRNATLVVINLSEDSEKRLWMVTGDREIKILDLQTDRFLPDGQLIQAANYRLLFKVVHTQQSTLLCGRYHVWHLRRDSTNKAELVFSLRDVLGDNDQLRNIHILSQNQAIAFTYNGHSVLIDMRGKAVTCRAQKLSKPIQVQFSKKQIGGDNIYISSFDAIYAYKAGGQLEKVLNTNSYFFAVDKDEHIWLSRKDSLKIIQRNGNGQWRDLFCAQVGHLQKNISSNRLSSMLLDKAGTIWLGTRTDGINRINPYKSKIDHLILNPDDHTSQPIKATVLLADSNRVFIGTTSQGLKVYTRHDGRVSQAFGKQLASYSTNRPFLRYLYKIRYGGLAYYLASADADLGYAQDLMQALNQGKPKLPKSLVQAASSAFTMCQTGEYVWFGSYLRGIVRYKLDTEQVSQFLSDSSSTSLSSNTVRSFCQDKRGGLWIGTSNGLSYLSNKQLSKSQPQFKVFRPNKQQANAISYSSILPLLQASDGTLWIGTFGGGLNHMTKFGEFESFGIKEGLSDNIIKAIVEDKQGNIWISGNNGLSRIDPKRRKVLKLSAADGLQADEFSEFAAMRTADGRLWFGGINGVNVFLPQELHQEKSTGKIVVAELSINNERVRPGTCLDGENYLEKIIDKTEKLKFRYDHNNISFRIALRSHLYPNKVSLRYKLLGLEENWSSLDLKYPRIKYTALASGDYTLLIQQLDGEHGAVQSKRVQLEIRPAPWASIWAKLLYLAVLGAVAFAVSVHLRTLRQAEMERYANQKTQELTALKLKFFTNVSHEFRTPLTLILGYLNREIKTNKRPQLPTSNLNLALRNANILKRLIDQLMDFRKLEQGKLQLTIAQHDLRSFCHEIYESFGLQASTKQLEFVFEAPEEEVLLYTDADKLGKVLYNLLANAFTHTPAHGRVVLALEKHADGVHIRVADTGVGIPKHMQEKVFERFFSTTNSQHETTGGIGIGMAYSKGLVELLGGTIQLQSEPGKGSVFSLRLPAAVGSLPEQAPSTEQATPAMENLPQKQSQCPANKLLVVDDNADIRQFLRTALGDAFVVLEADDGVSALEACHKHHPHLVISDVMMPNMDGYQFCNALKADIEINHIPVILLSAKSSAAAQVQGFHTGADAYVPKPFDVDVLKAQVQALIQARQQLWEKFSSKNASWKVRAETFNSNEEFLEKVTELIENCAGTSNFTVPSIAQSCGMSAVTFNKKIKAITNKTAKEFIRGMQLRMAKEMLEKTNESIADITYQVGFSDLNHFRKLFKNEFGKTPTNYRQNS